MFEEVKKFKEYKGLFSSIEDFGNASIENESFGTYKFFEPPIPVVFVGGMDGVTEEITLSLTFELLSRDVNVKSVGNEYSFDFLNQYSYKNILESLLKPSQMITEINKLIRFIYQKDSPDIIVIQIPGTTLKYNENVFGDYGVYSYIFSQAISCDYFLYCASYGVNDKKSISKLSEHLNSKFGFEINATHVANKLYDGEKSLKNNDLVYFNLSHDLVDKNIKEYFYNSSIVAYNLIDKKSMNDFINVFLDYFK